MMAVSRQNTGEARNGGSSIAKKELSRRTGQTTPSMETLPGPEKKVKGINQANQPPNPTTTPPPPNPHPHPPHPTPPNQKKSERWSI